jgi:hypothetical protein
MAKGRLRVWALAALLAMAACSTPAPKPAPPTPAPAPTPAPPQPQVSEAPPLPPADSCGASKLQSLVGKPHTDIPIPVDPSNRRVLCSTCVHTDDFISSRQTIVYDTTTGLVTSVTCG